LTATPIGVTPTGIVALTVFVAISITDTVLEFRFRPKPVGGRQPAKRKT
jgi:hypothetical protein